MCKHHFLFSPVRDRTYALLLIKFATTSAELREFARISWTSDTFLGRGMPRRPPFPRPHIQTCPPSSPGFFSRIALWFPPQLTWTTFRPENCSRTKGSAEKTFSSRPSRPAVSPGWTSRVADWDGHWMHCKELRWAPKLWQEDFPRPPFSPSATLPSSSLLSTKLW